MGSTLSTFDAILKTEYLGPIREQLNNSSVLYSRLEKNEDSVVGKNFTIPLHYGRNEGVGARAEGGTLPAAGNQAYKECIVPMKYQYGRIQITGPTIKAARTNEGAFLRAVDSEMRGLERDMKSSMNRQAFGDGTGLLATVAASGSGTSTVVVDSTAKLRVGMPIDIIVKTTGAATAGIAGTSVASITDATTFTITDTLAGSPDATYGVYIAGSRNKEMMGLSGIVSATSTLQGLDVANYPWWKATVLANGGTNRAISDTLLQTAIDTLEANSSGMCTAMYTSFGVRRAYQALLTATKQLVNTQKLQGGYEAISYLGGSHGVIPMIADKDAPANKIFIVDEDELAIYRLADFDWMQEDGSVLSRVSGVDAYEAVLYVYQELGTSMRNAHVLLSDITEA
jgi:hypothetical protein